MKKFLEQIVKYNMQSFENVLQKCNQLLEKNGTILFGSSYTRLVEKNKAYWISKFEKLNDTYDYLEKCVCQSNLIVWITPKIY